MLSPPVATNSVRTTCPYCGVGCGVIAEFEGDGEHAHITGVRGDPDHPANFGRLCTKGSTLHLSAQPMRQHQSRLAQPMRRSKRGGAATPIGWDDALDEAATSFADCIAAHGPDSVAFYVSGQLLTEDYYVFNKLAKGLIGTNNIDSNSRLCMSSAVTGYKATLGADAPPACYEDIDEADCLFIAGSNMAFAHPVLFRRVEVARERRPDMKLIVVDPRRTDTAVQADLHLAILPGTDVALFHSMLHVMLWEGWTKQAFIDVHTEGFRALRDRVRDCTPRWAADHCGVAEADIVQAARWFACSPASLSLYCQGLNQSADGTAKNAALINLHLATGQIGRPGAGPFSLTGQPNAMGGREVGGMASLASAHRDLGNADDREQIAQFWRVGDVPEKPGLTAVELFESIGRGEVRMVWIACTNPAQSLPDASQVHAALRRAEYVVVQEAFAHTATADFADLLLPATTWGEKDGTVTNSERRISRVRAALPAYRQSRADWAIAADFGRRLEQRLSELNLDRRCDPTQTLFGWADVQAVWEDHRALTRGRDLDITGLDYATLETRGPQQWPMPAGARQGRARLYEDGQFAFADGRARFADVPYTPVAERTDARHPMRLTTGRLRDQWHGMSRTGLLGRLFSHASEPLVELSEMDMGRLRLNEGDLVRVSSRRASQVLPVSAASSLRPGTAFIAMHWGPEYLGGVTAAGVNALTIAACDPVSRQPELKHCAVRIEPARLAHQLVAFARLPGDQVLRVRRALLESCRDLPFASAVPFGREHEGVLIRLGSPQRFDAARIEALEALFGVDSGALMTLDDARSGKRRHLLLRDGELCFALLSGDLSSEPWLRDFLDSAQDVAALGARLLAPGVLPPIAMQRVGRIVCNCVGVGESAIAQCMAGATGDRAERVRNAQRSLGCGTECGSCLPELGQMAEAAIRIQRDAA